MFALETERLNLRPLTFDDATSTNNKSFYSATSSHHQHHLNCLNCQRSIVVADCPISEKLDRWFQSQEFKVYYHTLEFFGLCPDCQNKATCYQNTESVNYH